MRVLVTGGNRYIGLHLLFELAAQGHEVTVVNSHEADMPEGCRRIHADRTRPGALVEALAPHRDDFDVVFDNTAYRPADLEPVLELFADRVQHLVFTSSTAFYRRSFVQPVTEDSRRHAPDDTDPRKAYGVGKVQCEDLLLSSGLPVTVLRVGHTLGPRTPLPTREPNLFKRLEEGRAILVPGDGFPFVHLVHVVDVARFMVACAGRGVTFGQAYNVTGTELSSVEGCIRLMARAVGVEPHVVHVPLDVARTAHPPLLHWGEALVGGAIYSPDKGRRDLGWEPTFGLEAGYADSYRWFDEVGRDRFSYDFSRDEEVLASLGRGPDGAPTG